MVAGYLQKQKSQKQALAPNFDSLSAILFYCAVLSGERPAYTLCSNILRLPAFTS